MSTADAVEQVAKLYGQQVWDYGASRGRGVGIVNGAGGLLTLMDLVPTLRWGWLLETPTGADGEQDFAEAIAVLADPVVAWCFFGWEMDDPELWQGILTKFPAERVVVYSDAPYLDRWTRATSLDQLPRLAAPGTRGAIRVC